MKKIFFAILALFLFVNCANAQANYNLSRMKQMNPDFTTYPSESGIIWLKHVTFSRSKEGGFEVERLFVILGKQGINDKWLSWNIPTPVDGSIKILESDIYDINTLNKISSASVNENLDANLTSVNFSPTSENFVIVISWLEHLPEKLTFEGLFWFQEDLRIWECVTEIYAPQKISYKIFPDPTKNSPEIEELDTEIIYRWRNINTDPYISNGLVRSYRSGCVFGMRTLNNKSVLSGLIKDAENSWGVPAPNEIKKGSSKLIDWLQKQPEIILTEGSSRKIPSKPPYSKREKIILAKSWLTSQKINSNILWAFPFEPDEKSPLLPELFYNPVLELPSEKKFFDFGFNGVINGMKVYSPSDGKFRPRKIPNSKSSENRLSAIMNLKLRENGFLSGNVRVILRGAWKDLRPDVNSLFPLLMDYSDVKYKDNEISFNVENKQGIAGKGQGILAVIPFFEPVEIRKLGSYEEGVEILFPFIIDQDITLEFPKNVKEALLTGKVARNPDKINYSHSYLNKRHRLLAEARFELNMQSVSSGNVSLLRRYLDMWRAFSSRSIPVR